MKNGYFETPMRRLKQKSINAGLFIVIMLQCLETEGYAALRYLNTEGNLLSYTAFLSNKASLFPHVTGSHLLCLSMFQRSSYGEEGKTHLFKMNKLFYTFHFCYKYNGGNAHKVSSKCFITPKGVCPKINSNLLYYARTDEKTAILCWSLESSEDLENFLKYKTEWFQNLM